MRTGSTIAGAFRLVAVAAGRMAKMRDCITETLISIPDIIQNASNYVDIYRKHPDPRLTQRSAELYKSVAIVLRQVMEYFSKDSWKRAGEAFFKGERYQIHLEENVKLIKRQADEVQEFARQCMHERVRKMAESQVQANSKLSEVHAELADLNQNLSQENFNRAVGTAVQNALMNMFRSSSFYDFPNDTVRLDLLMHADQRSVAKGPKPRRVLSKLEFDAEQPTLDNQRALAMRHTMQESDLGRAAWIVRSDHFKAWMMTTAGSGALLINSNGEPFVGTSPASLICAQASNLLQSARRPIVLSFFCGMHNEASKDRKANASGMLISLIGQLLQQVEAKDLTVDLAFLHDQDLKEAQKDIKVLVKVFRKVILQLPKHSSVFCLIDGLSLYEDPERRDETLHAVLGLRRTLKQVTEGDSRVVFKLLVTCPGHSMVIQDLFKRKDRLFAPSEVEDATLGMLGMHIESGLS